MATSGSTEKEGSELRLSDIIIRRPYEDGSPTPLLRGVLHGVMTVGLTAWWGWNLSRMTRRGSVSVGLILSSYLFSSLLHCVRFPPRLEVWVNILDHVMVHHQILAGILNLTPQTPSGIGRGVWLLFLGNYLLDTFRSLRYGFDYIFTRGHLVHYALAMLMALTTAVNYVTKSSNPRVNASIMCAYLTNAVGFALYFFRVKNRSTHRIWSSHETFHLMTTLGTFPFLYAITSLNARVLA